MTPLRERPTPDIVVLWLAFVAGAVILGGMAAAIVLRITDPDLNLVPLGIRLAGFINTIIGAVVGYVAGRAVVSPPEATPAKRRRAQP